MDVQPDIARVAALFADPTRSHILLYLLDGRAQPSSRIAATAGIAASTASAHLNRLVGEGALSVEQHGRNRYYRISDPRIVAIIEALLPLADTPSPTGLKASNRMQRLRIARTCYDHAAGQLGTSLLTGLLKQRALIRTDGLLGIDPATRDRLSGPIQDAPYALGNSAQEVFGAIGISLAECHSTRRPLIRACVDWTEQRHHLAGALGAAVLEALVNRDWVQRSANPRELLVKEPGRIAQWLSE